jgi:hypothetical protein
MNHMNSENEMSRTDKKGASIFTAEAKKSMVA